MTDLSSTLAIAFHPSRVEVAEMRQGLRGPKGLYLHSVDIASDWMCESSGRIVNRSVLSHGITSKIAYRSFAFRRRLVLVIPSALCFIRTIEVPARRGGFPNTRIEGDVREYLPCDPADLVVSVAPCGLGADGREIALLVAVKRNDLTPYIEIASHLIGEIRLVIPACVARWNGIHAGLLPESRDVVVLAHAEGGSVEACMWQGERLLGIQSGVLMSAQSKVDILRRDPKDWGQMLLHQSVSGISMTQGIDDVVPQRVIVRGVQCPNLSDTVESPSIRAHCAAPHLRVLEADDRCFDQSGSYDATLGALLTVDARANARLERV